MPATPRNRPSHLGALLRAAEEQQQRLSVLQDADRAKLPLKYWRQAAHYTTPADQVTLARKAVEAGTRPTAAMLDRLGLGPAALADALSEHVSSVEELLQHPERAPLVMLDGEDSVAQREESMALALATAAETLSSADWGPTAGGTLRFFRPSGFRLGRTANDLLGLFDLLRPAFAAGDRPLDGIVFPKIERTEEVSILFDLLEQGERLAGAPVGSTRVALLIESGWAAARVLDIASAASARLCALIFGIADYSAELGLPEIENDHPLADWARAAIINAAGAVGVPAIDGMTLSYPVIDRSAPLEDARESFVRRMVQAHRDALRGRAMGMSGKWVGHPAQLFAVLLAFRRAVDPALLSEHQQRLLAYGHAVTEGRGSTMIEGTMSDRATDRHVRGLLRRAVAMGQLDPRAAYQMDVITEQELAETDDLDALLTAKAAHG